MKKAAFASLLAVSAFTMAPGTLSGFGLALAQAAPAGQITINDPAEFADYDNAMNKTTAPAAQAPLLEAFLAKYPKTVVRNAVIQRIMVDYSQADAAGHEHTKAIASADAELAVNPNDLQAYVIEVAYRTDAAQALTDPAAKQAGLDAAADFARKGLAATKPDGMSDSDYAALKAFATPKFYAAIAADDTAKKDWPGAITAYKAELAAIKPADLTSPATLQEDFFLGNAYLQSTPPDYIDCTFYATRAAALAPDQFKPQLQPLASYCYKKYHGGTDGYDAVVAAAKATPDPAADFNTKITPAPTDADIVHNLVTSTPDLATLALSDKEFILQHGSPDDAAKVFDTIKGKSFQIPGALVISSTPTVLQVAVSDDAVQAKKADFTFNLKPIEEPKAGATPAAKREMAEYKKTMADIAAATAVGQTVTLQGTYDSYTPNPIMITMTDGSVILPKKAAPAPVHHTTHK